MAEALLAVNTHTLPSAGWSHLWPCEAMSRARRTGTGEPPSVTLSTSMDFLSGLRLPWRLSMGESTRFLGGSADGWQGSEVNEWPRLGVGGFAVEAGAAGDDLLTDLVARWQVLILVAGEPFLPVQQQEVDHLLLVLTGRRHKEG